VVIDTPPPGLPSRCALVLEDPVLGLYEFHAGDAVEGSAELPSPVLPLVLDGGTGQFIVSGDWGPPAPLDAETAKTIGAAFHVGSTVLDFLTGLYRRLASHPAHAGFIGHRLDTRGTSPSQWNVGYVFAGATEKVKALIPEGYWDGTYGWFAPDVDPEAFGQFFLYVTADNDEVIWEVRQVGLEAPAVNEARWDDAAGIRRIQEFCRTENPEHTLTVHALSDSGSVRTSRRKHDFALAVKAAREALARKKDQLKPRLTEAAVLSAARDSQELVSGTMLVRASVHVDNLTPYEVFGYRYQRDALPAVYGAARVLLHERARPPGIATALSEEFLTRFALQVQDNLDQRRLGTLFTVEYEDHTSLWIVKNSDLVQRHLAAFGIPADARWTPAVGIS
jgi:hypothetical protein